MLFAILLGYLGSTTGFVIYKMGNTISYFMAAAFAIFGYIGLGICSSFSDPSEWLFFFTLIFLILAAIGSGIAIVAAICTNVENFTRRGSILMIILMIGYFLIGYMFEYSIRYGLFGTTRSKYYFPCYGVFVAIVYALCAGLIQENRARFQDALIAIDQLGSLIYILVLTVFVIVLYFLFLRERWFTATFISFIVIFLINFILAGVLIGMSGSQVDDFDVRGSGLSEGEQGIRQLLDIYIFKPKLYCMLLASLCLVGVTSIMLYRIPEILTASGKYGSDLHSYYITIILTQTLSAIVLGLASYFSRNSLNEYSFGIFGALLAIVGIVLFIVTEIYSNISFIGIIFISIASGIGWVIFPLIVYDDAGPQPFGPLLSLNFLANYWGMCIFGFIFMVIMENGKQLVLIYVIYIIGCLVTITASLACMSLDD